MGRVAIVGISGIGKEHVRAAVAAGAEVTAIIDFDDVLQRECGKGTLTNTFPGYEFTIPIPETAELLPTGVYRYGTTHAIIATPPTQRHMVPTLTANGIAVYVEKPYRSSKAYPGVTVGYQYLMYGTPARKKVDLIAPHPGHRSWRLPAGGALWDLAGHALSMFPRERRSHFTPLSITPDWAMLQTPDGEMIDARYVRGGMPLCLCDGQVVDFREAFDASVARFLSMSVTDPTNIAEAIEIEDQLRRLEATL